MSQRGWWAVVALGLALGLVVGGVSGYVIGVNHDDESSSNQASVDRITETDPEPSDDGAADGGQQVSDTDICQASDVYNALHIFGTNANTRLTPAMLKQVRKAGNLFDRASDLASDADLVAALDKLASTALGAEVGGYYTFAPYNRFTTVCSGLGL